MSDNHEHLHAMRHSLAHITASAVKKLWPSAKFGVGPVVENGFYYDIDLGEQKISESDFKKIEKEMRTIINQAQEFDRFEMPVDEAIESVDCHGASGAGGAVALPGPSMKGNGLAG